MRSHRNACHICQNPISPIINRNIERVIPSYLDLYTDAFHVLCVDFISNILGLRTKLSQLTYPNYEFQTSWEEREKKNVSTLIFQSQQSFLQISFSFSKD